MPGGTFENLECVLVNDETLKSELVYVQQQNVHRTAYHYLLLVFIFLMHANYFSFYKQEKVKIIDLIIVLYACLAKKERRHSFETLDSIFFL